MAVVGPVRPRARFRALARDLPWAALARACAQAALCRVPRSGRPGVRRRRARRQSRPLLRRPGRPGDRDRAPAGVRRLAAPAVSRPATGHRARVRARRDAGRGGALRQPAHADRGDGIAGVDGSGAQKRRLRAGALDGNGGGARDHARCADRPSWRAALLQDRRRRLRGRRAARAVAADPRPVVRVRAGGRRRGAARRRAARRARALPLQSDHRRAPTPPVARVATGRRPGRLARRAGRSTNAPATSMPGSSTEAVHPAESSVPRARASGEGSPRPDGGLYRAVAAMEPAGRLLGVRLAVARGGGARGHPGLRPARPGAVVADRLAWPARRLL